MTWLRCNFLVAAMTRFGGPVVHGGVAVHAVHPVPPPQFMWPEALAFVAVGMLLIARLHEPKFPRFYYVSLVCAALCAIYAFTSGAWPLGIALGAYTVRLLTQRPRKHIRRVYDDREHPAKASYRWVEPTRLERLFGSKSSD